MFKQSASNWFGSIPPVTKNIIIINLLLWLIEMIRPDFGQIIVNTLGLHFWEAGNFNPAQVITYMFLHSRSSIFHIFFNMFTLWMFGRILEQVWGAKRFFLFYMVCGIGAALMQELVWSVSWQHEYISGIARLNGITYSNMQEIVSQAIANHDADFSNAISSFKDSFVTIGASGAVFGLLLGFAFVFPDMPLYLFFIPVPIKAKYMVIGYGVIEFFLGISSSASTIAHFAHLGGMLFGLVILLYWKKKGSLRGNRF